MLDKKQVEIVVYNQQQQITLEVKFYSRWTVLQVVFLFKINIQNVI